MRTSRDTNLSSTLPCIELLGRESTLGSLPKADSDQWPRPGHLRTWDASDVDLAPLAAR